MWLVWGFVFIILKSALWCQQLKFECEEEEEEGGWVMLMLRGISMLFKLHQIWQNYVWGKIVNQIKMKSLS